MAKKKSVKTNAVRLLENEQVPYELMEYDIHDGQLDGVSVAEKTGQATELVYKTLVTIAGPRELFVFIVPVAEELDLKKAAKAVGVKKLDMLPLKDLTNSDRICPWRLLGNRHEEKVSDCDRRFC